MHVAVDSFSQIYAGLTGNVSAGGVFVATWQTLTIGAKVALRVVLPDAVVTAEGVVRWRREPSEEAPPGFGVAFTAIAPEDVRTLEAFCAERTPLYHDVDG